MKANLDAADAAHAATHKLNCIKRVLRHLESESRGSRRNKRSNAQIKLYKEGVEEQLTPGVGTTS